MKNEEYKVIEIFSRRGGGRYKAFKYNANFSTCCLYVGTPYTGQLKTFKYTRLNPYIKS